MPRTRVIGNDRAGTVWQLAVVTLIVTWQLTSGWAAGAITDLSVAPLQQTVFPDDRPHWIEAEPDLTGQVHHWPVVSSPALTPEASQQNLEVQSLVAVEAYLEQHLAGYSVDRHGALFDQEYVQRHLLDGDQHYHGMVTTSSGPMHEHAVQLRFDPDFRREAEARFQNIELEARLAILAVLGGGSLAALLGVSTLLKMVARVRRLRPVNRTIRTEPAL